MMKLLFSVTEERLEERDMTIDERLLLMGAGRNLEAMRDILAWFLTDVEGKYLPEGEAKRLVGKVKRSEIGEVWGDFQSALVAMLLPKATASSS
jgi:hypothetical protein